MAPVRIGPKTYAQRHEDVSADIQKCDLAPKITLGCQPLEFVTGRGRHPYGYSYENKGFRAPPVLPSGDIVARELWRYLHNCDGAKQARVRPDFKAPWHIKMAPNATAHGGA